MTAPNGSIGYAGKSSSSVTLAVSTMTRSSQAGALLATLSTVLPSDAGTSRFTAAVNAGMVAPSTTPSRHASSAARHEMGRRPSQTEDLRSHPRVLAITVAATSHNM